MDEYEDPILYRVRELLDSEYEYDKLQQRFEELERVTLNATQLLKKFLEEDVDSRTKRAAQLVVNNPIAVQLFERYEDSYIEDTWRKRGE